ncbi:exported hypothetical protein [Agrobacterium tumefaciens str. B6]|uniref:Uncharacterized protein n=1 Tax=Agrobacterium tumefaciens str. B6 TaxID=1183423 RepID=A0A822VD01_AGRTU|nr:exported hypothetical protein [Agrobacterium tumefaciens str. B6]
MQVPRPAFCLSWGALGGLQTASILAAAPFLLAMVGLCVSLWMGLLDDIEVHGHFEELEAKLPRLKRRARQCRRPPNLPTPALRP